MANCKSTLTKIIDSSCNNRPQGGIEVKAWLINRSEMDYTIDVTLKSQVQNITMITGAVAYPITGVKKLLNAGHDIVVAEDRGDAYTHAFSFQQFEFLTEDIENVDAANDLVVIVERKAKNDTGDGIFKLYGLTSGLYKTADTQRMNDIDGARSLEMATQGGETEAFSSYTVFDTDYATTLAMIESLETAS